MRNKCTLQYYGTAIYISYSFKDYIQGVPIKRRLAYNIQYLRNARMYQHQILYMYSWTLYEQLLVQQLFSPTPNFGGIDSLLRVLWQIFKTIFMYFWNFLCFEIFHAFPLLEDNFNRMALLPTLQTGRRSTAAKSFRAFGPRMSGRHPLQIAILWIMQSEASWSHELVPRLIHLSMLWRQVWRKHGLR